MDDVIENCQTTFEEDGVNQQTLDDLRKVRQSRFILCRIFENDAKFVRCRILLSF